MRGFRQAATACAFVCASCAVEQEETVDAGEGVPQRRDFRRHDGGTGDQGGTGTTVVLHLPIRAGNRTRCTQGPGGAYSHAGTSTRHGVDLDTSNTAAEEVFAPISGIARVHREDLARNFGLHVNLDLGDGTFVLLAHLKEVLVGDGEPVVEGQLIALEGCTGACTGDHIHLGHQRGDASRMAQFSESLPFVLLHWNAGAPDGIGQTDAADLVCGTGGTPSWIHSVLPVACAHPDGALVKTATGPKVYRIDDGARRWIVDETVFRGYGYDFADVVTVSVEELETYAEGPNIALPGMVEDGVDDDGQYWLFVGAQSRSDKYRIRLRDEDLWSVLASWGIVYYPQDEPEYQPYDSPLLYYWPERGGYATFRDGTLLKEAGNPRVYAVSHGVPLPFLDEAAFRLAGYDFSRVIEAPDGALERHFPAVGSCEAGGEGCLTQERFRQCLPIDAAGISSVGGSTEGGDEDGSTTSGIPDAGMHTTIPEDDAPAARDPAPDGGASGIRDGDDDASSQPDAFRTLAVTWSMPMGRTARRITLSGEYRLADGSLGFLWHDLAEVHEASALSYWVAGVEPSDAFRFSVEFEAVDGEVSWSCIGPFIPGNPEYQGTRQGTVAASVDGVPVPVANADDPTSAGCGLILTVP